MFRIRSAPGAKIRKVPAFVPDSFAAFGSTDDMERITWVNSQVAVLAFTRDTLDRTKQAALGGSWNNNALTISADVSYTASRNELLFSGLTLGSTAENFTHALATARRAITSSLMHCRVGSVASACR
jgi:hypothetical protein